MCECAWHLCGYMARMYDCVCVCVCVWHALINVSLVHTATGRGSPKGP